VPQEQTTIAALSQPPSNDMSGEAVEHLIFAVTDVEDLRRNGPVILAQGSGIRVTDLDGRSYVDMIGSGSRANSLGYGREDLARAYHDQALRMHFPGTGNFTTEPTIRLAKTLAQITPGDLSRCFFTSGGSEAVESALKLAKASQQDSGRKPRAYKVISRWNAYHGSTMGAMSVTNWLSVAQSTEPRVPGVSFVPSPKNYRNPLGLSEESFAEVCARALERQILLEGPDQVAAFIAEPVMQADGVQIAPRSYWEQVREICDRYGVYLIIDEVICGFGRTGKWFASEHFGIRPDLMTMAKAMTAGYAPMGCAIAAEAVAAPIGHFRHVHTYSGHPACAAVANAVIATKAKNGLVEQAGARGPRILAQLKAEVEPLAIVGQVRGLGHWHAIEFTADKATRAVFTDNTVVAVRDRLRRKGVMVGIVGQSLEIAPPLIATDTEIFDAIAIIAEAIREIAAERGLDRG